MLVIVCIYLTLYAVVFFVDGAISLSSLKSDKALFQSKISPYIRGLEYLMGIYLISIIELGISLTGIITDGFVGYTTAILTIFAIVYLAEFVYNRYKLRDHVMILPLLSKTEVKAVEGIINVMGDNYIVSADVDKFNDISISTTGTKARKKTAITLFAIGVIMIITMIIIIIAAQPM